MRGILQLSVIACVIICACSHTSAAGFILEPVKGTEYTVKRVSYTDRGRTYYKPYEYTHQYMSPYRRTSCLDIDDYYCVEKEYTDYSGRVRFDLTPLYQAGMKSVTLAEVHVELSPNSVFSREVTKPVAFPIIKAFDRLAEVNKALQEHKAEVQLSFGLLSDLTGLAYYHPRLVVAGPDSSGPIITTDLSAEIDPVSLLLKLEVQFEDWESPIVTYQYRVISLNESGNHTIMCPWTSYEGKSGFYETTANWILPSTTYRIEARALNAYGQISETAAVDVLTAATEEPLYFTSFDASVDGSWSPYRPTTSPGTPKKGPVTFAGRYKKDEEVVLSLYEIPPHSAVTVTLDLFIIGLEWYGNGIYRSSAIVQGYSTDWSMADISDNILYRTTFSTFDGNSRLFRPNLQSFPDKFREIPESSEYPAGSGAAEKDTLGYIYRDWAVSNYIYYMDDYFDRFMDYTYPVTVKFQHSDDTLTLKFKSNAGEWGMDNFRVQLVSDTSPPEAPVVSDAGYSTPVMKSVEATWSSTETDIVDYLYAVGTTPEDTGSYLINWRSSNGKTRLRIPLNVTPEMTIYWYVKAVDSSGNVSPVGVSDGVYVVPRVVWNSPGGNGHSYQVVTEPSGIRWNDAERIARQSGGYLATPTTEAENQFIFSLIAQNRSYWLSAEGAMVGPWIGGWQYSKTSEPRGDWKWMFDDTDLTESFWAFDQPDNAYAGEDRIHYTGQQNSTSPYWNDAHYAYGVNGKLPVAYVVEFDPSWEQLWFSDFEFGRELNWQISGFADESLPGTDKRKPEQLLREGQLHLFNIQYAKAIRIDMDMCVIGTWDGSQRTMPGVGKQTVIGPDEPSSGSYTLSNIDFGGDFVFRQSYPNNEYWSPIGRVLYPPTYGALEVNSLGHYVDLGGLYRGVLDSVYRTTRYDLELPYYANREYIHGLYGKETGMQYDEDERLAWDNVTVRIKRHPNPTIQGQIASWLYPYFDSSRTSVSAFLESTDVGDSVSVEYAVGTTPNDPSTGYFQNWQSGRFGANDVLTTGMQAGVNYYVYFRYRENNVWKPAPTTNPTRKVDTIPRNTHPLTLPDGLLVGFYAERVIATPQQLGNRAYTNIAIQTSQPVTIDTDVYVAGIMSTDENGERFVANASVTPSREKANAGFRVNPLNMPLKAIPSSNAGYDPTTGKGQRGVDQPRPLNASTIARLVRTTGRVTKIDDYVYLNDGSFPDSEGIRVIFNGVPPSLQQGDFICVTGISTMRKIDGVIYAAIWPRDLQDWQIED